MPWLRVVHTPEEDLAYFRDIVLAQTDVWVVRPGAGVQGFVARRGDWIEHLYVAPEAWGQGLGARLLKVARDGQASLQLWTFRRNTGACRFYKREGFISAEATDGARNEEREPDIRYVWSAGR